MPKRPETHQKETGLTSPKPKIGDYVAIGLAMVTSSLMTTVNAAVFMRALSLTVPEYVVTAGLYFGFFSVLWVIRLGRIRLSFAWHLLTYGLMALAFSFSFAILVFVLYLGPNL